GCAVRGHLPVDAPALLVAGDAVQGRLRRGRRTDASRGRIAVVRDPPDRRLLLGDGGRVADPHYVRRGHRLHDRGVSPRGRFHRRGTPAAPPRAAWRAGSPHGAVPRVDHLSGAAVRRGGGQPVRLTGRSGAVVRVFSELDHRLRFHVAVHVDVDVVRVPLVADDRELVLRAG